jgi:hypothetical protein
MFITRCCPWWWPMLLSKGEYDFELRRFGSSPDQLRLLTEWLVEQKIQEVVLESTEQYWRPVWQTLEQHW